MFSYLIISNQNQNNAPFVNFISFLPHSISPQGPYMNYQDKGDLQSPYKIYTH
nr:MAG TPA: hypothetical protein [Crassvirales sp.]